MNIARATAEDLDAIDAIERHSFPRPWPRSTFEAELARDVARVVVARDRTRVLGFINYWLVAGELHVLAVAVEPDARRKGVAGALVSHALDEARTTGCTLATLEVRRGNQPAIALYERAGFRTVHVRERYYQDNNEDALVMLSELAR